MHRWVVITVLLGVVAAQTAISTRTTKDNDGNGKIDSIYLSFSGSATGTAVDAAVKAGAFTVVGYTVNKAAGWNTVGGYFTLVEGPVFDTGATPGVKFTAGSTAIGSVPSDPSPIAATDQASPVIVAAVACSDGSNRVFNVQFSEPVTNPTNSGPLLNTNFAVDNTACPGGTAASGFSSVANLNLDSDGSDKVVSLTANSIIKFAANGGNIGCTKITGTTAIQDLHGNTVVASVGPTLQGVDSGDNDIGAHFNYSYVDRNSNGKIDALLITSEYAIRDNMIDSSVWGVSTLLTPTRTGYRLNSGYGDATVYPNDIFYFVEFNETTDPLVFDTHASLTVTTNVAGSSLYPADWRADPSIPQTPNCVLGFLLDTPIGVAVADAAAPVVVAAITLDTNNNGQIDGIQLTFSEPYDSASTLAADWTVSTPSYTITNISTAGAASSRLVISLTESGTSDTGVTPTVTYSKAVSALTDGYGNFLLSGSSIVAADKVAPVLLSATGIAVSTLLTLTFSEPVKGTGTAGAFVSTDIEYHDAGNNGATSISGVQQSNGASGVVVYTVTPNFAQTDFGVGGDSVNAKANSVSDNAGNFVGTTQIKLDGPSAAFRVTSMIWLAGILALVALLAV